MALINLARDQSEEAYAKAGAVCQGLSNEELLALAKTTEEARNRALLGICVRIPPSRRISCWTKEGSTAKAILECGHEVRIHVNRTHRVARCRRCLEKENREILENMRGKKIRTTGGDGLP